MRFADLRRSRANGSHQSSSAGKNAVSMRGTLSGLPVFRLTGRKPGHARYPPRQDRASPGFNLQQDRVLAHSEALGAYSETVDSVRPV